MLKKKTEIAEKKQARPFRDRKIVGLALFASGKGSALPVGDDDWLEQIEKQFGSNK